MPSPRAASKPPLAPSEALEKFLGRVLRLQAAARRQLAPDTVHDLRVALRRCRSLAEGLAEIGGGRRWRKLAKAAKRLQSGLAAIRDCQVMSQWAVRLGLAGGACGQIFGKQLARREKKARRKARQALAAFPRRKWKRWRKRLPELAARISPPPAALAAVTLRRAAQAAEREARWRAHRSQEATHRLRIAVKQFRYTAESFQPRLHQKWKTELKAMQDCLGEIHDLDLLRQWIAKLARGERLDRKTVRGWMSKIQGQRARRVQTYQAGAADSRWSRWQAEIAKSGGLSPADCEPS